MAGPLTGVTILDFTWALAGPFGTMILCDLGAEVWKVEAVGIDEEHRGPGPVVDGINTYFFSVNRGKKSITLDLRSERGRETGAAARGAGRCRLRELLARHHAAPGPRLRSRRGAKPVHHLRVDLGFRPDRSLCRPRRGRRHCAGHGRAHEYHGRTRRPARARWLLGGRHGGGHVHGHRRPGGPFEREKSGQGQYIDVSMFDCQVNLLENAMVRYGATGEVPQRIGSRHPLVTPFQAFPTSDGWVVIAGVKDWELFCGTMGLDHLVTDERFASNRSRTQHHAELEPILNEAFQQASTAEWLERLADICLIGPVQTIDQVADDPHVQAREMLVDLPSSAGRDFRVVNSPIRYSRTKVHLTEGADRPGGHTDEILQSRLGATGEELAELFEDGIIGRPGQSEE
ncbi:MAG: CaiB/BaiF CoA-transferase family protein [Dehalococcoidia bacterium]|nr:CaiB/BaiF CoA-transferase family protein [Dehalococcoidia bacterium]